jgi:hypothetical protein
MGDYALKIKKNAALNALGKAWSPFKEVDLSKITGKKPVGIVQAFTNNLYSVQVFKRKMNVGEGHAALFGIRAHVGAMSSKMTWAVKQRIKNELAGKERLAFECYPPVSELVDGADMYWLWIMPEGEKMPFKLFG